jgi:hypothetical protein
MGPPRGIVAFAIRPEAGGGRRLVRRQGTPPLGGTPAGDKFGAFIVNRWGTAEISAPNL